MNTAKRKRVALQVTVTGMLLAMIPIGVMCLFLGQYIANAEVNWQPFSQSALETSLADGRIVVVFFSADWDIGSAYSEKELFTDEEIRDSLQREKAVTLRADCTDQWKSQDIRAVHDYVSPRRQLPLIAVFGTERPHEPIIVYPEDGMYLQKADLLDA